MIDSTKLKVLLITAVALLALVLLFAMLYFTKPKVIVVQDTKLADSLQRELILTRAARDSSIKREKQRDGIFRKALALQQQDTKAAEITAQKAVQKLKALQAAAPIPERDSVVNEAVTALADENTELRDENTLLRVKVDEKTTAYNDLANQSQSESRIAAQMLDEEKKQRATAETNYEKTAKKLGFWKGAAVSGTVLGAAAGFLIAVLIL